MNTPKGIYLIFLLERFVWGLIPAAVVVALVLARTRVSAPAVAWAVLRTF